MSLVTVYLKRSHTWKDDVVLKAGSAFTTKRTRAEQLVEQGIAEWPPEHEEEGPKPAEPVVRPEPPIPPSKPKRRRKSE